MDLKAATRTTSLSKVTDKSFESAEANAYIKG
jgi:hypothetical protein